MPPAYGPGLSEKNEMRRFNLSEWAVHQPALVLFFILGFGIAGALAFARLGRAEDPNFTIKVAIVTAIWPGATAEEMQDQVSDRIEKKLQELPYFDRVQTYTKPSFTAMQVVFRDHTPAKEVPQLFYQLRKKLGDICGRSCRATSSARTSMTNTATSIRSSIC